MASISEIVEQRPYWFVGASFAGKQDQTVRFTREGIWEDHSPTEQEMGQINSMHPGDRIAIKSCYTQKHALPFDNRGQTVGAMYIKAVGTITENPENGYGVKVNWAPVEPPRRWFFTQLRKTNHRVLPGTWEKDGLISFTFEDRPQDINSFRNAPKWREKFGDVVVTPENIVPKVVPDPEPSTPQPYTIDNIMAEGCFLERDRLEGILEHFRFKKNLILQGPPGTGKTWLARKLAFALMGQRDEGRLYAVQFHPNLSYEDFVRGWRPSGDGQLDLVDGPFVAMINAARKDPDSTYVMVIEEINRGNPAQVFGEMLTLLEADKRNKTEALSLSYRKSGDERVYIPHNLYLIGTMNLADRSLALVDLAFRRRFAFEELEPTFGQRWQDWVNRHCGIDAQFLADIEGRLVALNRQITGDRNLGRQFGVGHSYVTPSSAIPDPRAWFVRVVEKEIGPLLDEYWFDSTDTVQQARAALLDGL